MKYPRLWGTVDRVAGTVINPVPRHLGVAWRHFGTDTALLVVWPLNYVLRAARSAYYFLRFPDPNEWELRQVAAFEKGRELGRAQSDAHEYQRGFDAAMRATSEQRAQARDLESRRGQWLLVGGPSDGKVVDIPDDSRPEIRVSLKPNVSVSWAAPSLLSAAASVESGVYKPTNVVELHRRVMRWQGPS